ncbi:hypothetical protein [Pedobacter hartonius]|uniref:Peptidase propeptide and YPEB domain-containing protein n=1 Tax=Pedobacter hartonius TaxID=425514 RepID=A0A1H3VZH4_9SPHI|nr:hypothetical protein [Pedobacter hartonius]SDZ79604.1 hypothetical protein SAMN05443550_1015 [Pedobacter hartonius]
MKTFILSILFIFPFAAIAQRTFKFSLINAETGKPMAKKWVTILKDKDRWINFVHSDSLGIVTFSTSNYDSTATYQAEIVNRWENSVQAGMFDITGIKNSQPVIKLTPAAYSMPYACGTRMYSGYQPKEPYSINELPHHIQVKVKSYLSSRVGKDFCKKLLLNGGQIVDIERLYAVNPSARSWESVPPIYSLCFMVWDRLKRSSSYNFILNLNQKGTLLGIVELPDIKHNSTKGKIMTMDDAKKIALANSFYDKYTKVNSCYYKKIDSIVWVFEQQEPGEGTRNLTKLLINAHTGAIVDRVTSKVEVMY